MHPFAVDHQRRENNNNKIWENTELKGGENPFHCFCWVYVDSSPPLDLWTSWTLLTISNSLNLGVNSSESWLLEGPHHPWICGSWNFPHTTSAILRRAVVCNSLPARLHPYPACMVWIRDAVTLFTRPPSAMALVSPLLSGSATTGIRGVKSCKVQLQLRIGWEKNKRNGEGKKGGKEET